MATQTPTPTETRTCPTCGARIARPDLSLCSYCATPLGLGKKSAEEIEEGRKITMERLSKMEAHDAYAQALAWTPPESIVVREAHGRRRWGMTTAAVGVLLFAVYPGMGWFVGTLAVALIALGMWRVVAASRLITAGTKFPLQRRPVLVADRRSETVQHGMRGLTVYFYTFEFQDGNIGEFRSPGTGAAQDPLAIKTTGLAYTRGAELLAFRAIRV
jgi:hypothetical protein